MQQNTQYIAIIGAGPAGLTAAYQLSKHPQFKVVVFEQDPQYVGGISRTEVYKGFRFDIGGHRFFSKSQEVEDLWTEILGDDMLERPRSSRIYYNKQFFSYPLRGLEVLRKLGIWESGLCMLSYLAAKMNPIRQPKNFEEWVSNQFGKRLYRIFFKTYTEKVWGIPCTEISADWAAQRIKGLNLTTAIRHALFPPDNNSGDKSATIKTLIDSFRYPRFGPGQMWETCRDKAVQNGAQVSMNTAVNALSYDAVQQKWKLQVNGQWQEQQYDHVISSAPLRHLFTHLQPMPPTTAIDAANALQYRDFITVVLMLEDKNLFSDNWIYIHDPSVKVGRIQHFKSWSPYMVPDEKMVCYGLEYFCFEGDGLWTSKDEDLIAMAKSELEKIGLGKAAEVTDGYVVRQPKAYPVYDQHYQQHVNTIAEAMQQYPGLVAIGRNGMHKYNNQDHSMMTAMLAARNIIAGKNIYDLWQVNQDAEYHEAGERGAQREGGRMVPMPAKDR